MMLHQRFGHVPFSKLQSMSLVSSNSDPLEFDSCVVCSKSKQHRLLFPKSQTSFIYPFDLLHLDVWGCYKHSTYDGDKYFSHNWRLL